MKTAESAWGYEQRGRNFVGRRRRVYLQADHVEVLASATNGADALMLFSMLESRHWGRPDFAAAPEAMARAGVIAYWGRSPNRYRRALALLVHLGMLDIVHQGGRGQNDPRLYCFPEKREQQENQ